MKEIANYEKYTDLMRNGFYDKLFFVDKLMDEWTTFVDYGCADGSLTRMIADIFPDKKIIGYDEDPNMISKAWMLTNKNKYANLDFVTDLKQVPYTIDVMYLSSIIHEVYSYQSATVIDDFWRVVFETDFKYVVIRDMIYDEALDRPSNINDVRRIYKYCDNANIMDKLKDFERTQGTILNFKNLVHFLLKYSYVDGDNWPRELRENYFPLSMQKFYELIPFNYRIEYQENYTLPYLKHKWEKDFHFFVDESIHSKFILKKYGY